MAINKHWHEQHKLDKNAKLEERLAWHIEHAAHCGCRKMPKSILQALEKRGTAVPAQRS